MDRNQWLRKDISPDLLGLELGPLDRPIIRRPENRVIYADHLDREGLRRKYANHKNVLADAIPEIDHVIGDQPLSHSIGKGRLHYILASHVIEHVPNPIGWLSDFHEMLVDGGMVILAIPDKRRCFDAIRRESIAADWIEAHLCNHVRPSPARIFDALSQEVQLNGSISWNTEVDPLELKLSRSVNQAYAMTKKAQEAGEYFDVHCWTFTPNSFSNLMRTIVACELLHFKLEEITPTAGNEFLVKLKRDGSLARNQLVYSYPAKGGRYDHLPENFDALAYLRLNPDVERAGVDAYEHYLEYGMQEQRSFR